MRKEIENSISMFKTVKAVCDVNIAVINSNVGLNTTYNQYLILLGNTEQLVMEQTLDRTGITLDKKDQRDLLANLVEAASGIIKAFFDSVHNNDIFTSVDVSFTKLRTMRDHEFIAHTQTVVNLLTTHQAVLAPYGVDAAYLTTFNSVFTNYLDLVAKPTMARNNKTTATLLLKEKVKETLLFLKKELDNVMKILKWSNTSFYITYRNARKTLNIGIRHKEVLLGSISGVVKDEISNLVLPDALIEIVGTETLVITNHLGEFTIVNIPPETYIIKASIGNYDIKLTDNVIVSANEDTAIEIKLTHSA